MFVISDAIDGLCFPFFCFPHMCSFVFFFFVFLVCCDGGVWVRVCGAMFACRVYKGWAMVVVVGGVIEGHCSCVRIGVFV